MPDVVEWGETTLSLWLFCAQTFTGSIKEKFIAGYSRLDSLETRWSQGALFVTMLRRRHYSTSSSQIAAPQITSFYILRELGGETHVQSTQRKNSKKSCNTERRKSCRRENYEIRHIHMSRKDRRSNCISAKWRGWESNLATLRSRLLSYQCYSICALLCCTFAHLLSPAQTSKLESISSLP